jgi:hypothetical protein
MIMTKPLNYGYDADQLTALEAITAAQKIAFAPMVFQAASSLCELGILDFLSTRNGVGASRDEICAQCDLDVYAVGVLLDVALSARILYRREAHYCLGKIGHFLVHDEMTRVNMRFTRDVCYKGLAALTTSLREGRPVGLSEFGEGKTIYPLLSSLPDNARESWFDFDHFYSDGAFKAALPKVFALKPHHLYDVGGNTGKWALSCCDYDPEVQVTILDLPEQTALAQDHIAARGMQARIQVHPIDLLSDAVLPGQADVWWMSQFLDCFSEGQIVRILKNIAGAMRPQARVCIMELFWDRQPYEAGAFSLNASSLYFTCLANGTSRFYGADQFIRLIRRAGLEIDSQVEGLGVGHTLLICRKAA